MKAVDLNAVAVCDSGGVEWVVDGLVPRGFLACIFGRGESFKSSLALVVALSVATGRPALGKASLTGPVLWLDAEQDASVTAARCRAVLAGWGDEAGIIPRAFRYVSLRGLSLTSSAAVRDLRVLVDTERPVLIVVDSVRMVAMDIDANEAGPVQGLLAVFDAIAAANGGVGVLLIDHTAAADSAKPIGSIAKLDVIRAAHHVVRDRRSNMLKVATVKSNFRRAETAVYRPSVSDSVIRFDAVPPGGAGRVPVEAEGRPAKPAKGEEVRTRILEILAAGPATDRAVAEAVGAPLKTAQNRLSDLKGKGLAVKLASGEWARE